MTVALSASSSWPDCNPLRRTSMVAVSPTRSYDRLTPPLSSERVTWAWTEAVAHSKAAAAETVNIRGRVMVSPQRELGKRNDRPWRWDGGVVERRVSSVSGCRLPCPGTAQRRVPTTLARPAPRNGIAKDAALSERRGPWPSRDSRHVARRFAGKECRPGDCFRPTTLGPAGNGGSRKTSRTSPAGSERQLAISGR